MNLPNKLTLIRLFLIPVFIAVFYLNVIPYNMLIAAIIFVLASITDFLDGYIARKYNLVTDLGKFLDPIADKVLVLASFIVILTKPEILTASVGEVGIILGGVGVSIIVAREMIVSVMRMIAATKGMVLAAEKVGKIKTFETDIALLFLIISPIFSGNFAVVFNWITFVLYAIAVLLTIYSGVVYLIKNKGLFKQ